MFKREPKYKRYHGHRFSNHYLDLSNNLFNIYEEDDSIQSRLPLKTWEYDHIINQTNTDRDEHARDRAVQLVFWSIGCFNDQPRVVLINSSIHALALYTTDFQARVN